MAARQVWIGAVMAAVLVAFGGVGLTAYNAGQKAGHASVHSNAGTISMGLPAGTLVATDTGQSASNPAAAPATGAAQGGMGIAVAYPWYGGGTFQPGFPPYFGQALSGDGLGSLGVAYRETSDATAQPGSDLIHAALIDAHNRAQTLASASGVSLGKVLAIDDFTQVQPWYRPCAQPQPAPGAPQEQGRAGGAPGVVASPIKGTILPQPACNPTYYQVAWVLLRYTIG